MTVPLDFSPYLEALCERYQQWQTLYTLTDVEGKEKLQEKLENHPGQWDSPFDFGLMVQTAVKDHKGQNPEAEKEEKEKVERFPVLEGIRKYAKDHVLLVGRPGSGKSTALAKLVLEEAEQKRSIPVLVELRSWQGSIVTLIGNVFRRNGLTLTEGQLEALWQDDRLLLLFDGLNELPSEEARSQLTTFRQDHPKIPMIFTTRELSVGGDFGIEKRLEMQPLTELQMQAFVRSYLPPDQAEQMLRQLSGRLQELGQTPLLLWMLCALFRDTEKIPENLGLVFRWFTQSYERKLKQDVRVESDREWWQPVLQQLAWVMMQGTQPTELRMSIARSDAVRAIAQFLEGKVPHAEDFARKCLRDLQKHHLIQMGAGHEELEFRHQMIQEYYAAEALLERLPGLSNAGLQREYLNYLKWTEPVALMLALVDDSEVALRVVRSGLEVDLMLGARLAGEVKKGFQGWAIECLLQCLEERTINTQKVIIELLIRTRSEAAILHLQAALQDQDSEVRQKAAFALGQIGYGHTVNVLLTVLRDQEPLVRRSAVTALWKIGDEYAIDILLIALQDQDLNVRTRAIHGLGKIGSRYAMDALLRVLQHQKPSVRSNAAKALGQVNDENSLDGLFIALQDEDPFVRWSAIEALGQVSSEHSEQAVDALIAAFQNQESELQWSIVGALGQIGCKHAITGLLRASHDQDSDVCEKASESLGKIGNESM
jgi:HEAT repeat protein